MTSNKPTTPIACRWWAGRYIRKRCARSFISPPGNGPWTSSIPASAKRVGVNDLNGLIYYDGEYHLFAQRWAKCWLHAVSKDMVHWTELPPAFWEEGDFSGVQSGHCVIDYNNTSGLSPDKATPPMIAFWPRWDNRNQCISYSLDHGRTWKAYEKNPILVHPERDPMVFWYAPTKHWVMILYGETKYHILTSLNLLEWKDENHPIPNCYECPDFFELPIDGDASNKKWVLIQGNGKYSIGTFNGVEFKEETDRLSCDIGPNFYATQSWGNTETGDGRHAQCAWMRCDGYPNMPFSQEISFPCEMSLHSTPQGLRVYRKPIRELESLRGKPDLFSDRPNVNIGNAPLVLQAAGDVYEIDFDVNISAGATLNLDLLGNSLSLKPNSIKSGSAHATLPDPIKHVQILIDRVSIETFLNDGQLSSTRSILPTRSGLSMHTDGGAVEVKSLKVFPLKSIWPPQ